MKQALILSYSDISRDPRPLRAIKALSELGFIIDCICLEPENQIQSIRQVYKIPACPLNFWNKVARKIFDALIRLSPLSAIKEFLHLYRYNLRSFIEFDFNNYNIVLIEDLSFLPLVHGKSSWANIIFDAREFYPRQNEEKLFFRFFEMPERLRICHKYLKKNQLNITVSPGLKNEYDKLFGTNMSIILSAPDFVEQKPRQSDGLIRIVHHGACNRNRKIETMIEVGRMLPSNYQLDFYLVNTDAKYLLDLKALASDCSNIRFMDPVKHEDINKMLSNYDIGLFIVEPTTFNLRYCLPNKLFEFVQAKLMVCVGPSPDMARIVNDYDLGIVFKDFSVKNAVSDLLNLSFEKIDLYKRNSYEASRFLNRGVEADRFKKLIVEIM